MSDAALWLKHPWAFSEMEAKTMKDQMLRLLDKKDAEIERLRAELGRAQAGAIYCQAREDKAVAAERLRTWGYVGLAAAIRRGEP